MVNLFSRLTVFAQFSFVFRSQIQPNRKILLF